MIDSCLARGKVSEVNVHILLHSADMNELILDRYDAVGRQFIVARRTQEYAASERPVQTALKVDSLLCILSSCGHSPCIACVAAFASRELS